MLIAKAQPGPKGCVFLLSKNKLIKQLIYIAKQYVHYVRDWAKAVMGAGARDWALCAVIGPMDIKEKTPMGV